MVQEAEMPHMCANQARIQKRSTLQVTGTPKALREYSLQGQTATGGLKGCWKIFAAKAKKEGKPLLDLHLHIPPALQAVCFLLVIEHLKFCLRMHGTQPLCSQQLQRALSSLSHMLHL